MSIVNSVNLTIKGQVAKICVYFHPQGYFPVDRDYVINDNTYCDCSLIENSEEAFVVSRTLALGIGIGVVICAAALAVLITKCTRIMRTPAAEQRTQSMTS